jgi:hypothetical protein
MFCWSLFFGFCLASYSINFVHALFSTETKNGTTLLISSVMLNSGPNHSLWVESLFGNESTFWRRSKKYNFNSDSGEPMSAEEKELLRNNMKTALSKVIPQYAFSTACSIELAGFVALERGIEPFMLNYRHKVPSVGTGTFGAEHVKWKCAYRASYDNWRNGERRGLIPLSGIYWPVFIYCYPPEDSANSCPEMDAVFQQNRVLVTQEAGVAHLQLSTQQQGQVLDLCTTVMLPSAIEYTVFNNTDSVGGSRSSKKVVAVRPSSSPPRTPRVGKKTGQPVNLQLSQVVVCTSLPFVTPVPGKAEIVNEILHQWARYYSSLGVKMIVFDRSGARKDVLVDRVRKNPSYKTSVLPHSTRSRIDRNLVYFNYTMLELLDTKRAMPLYDNSLGITADLVRLDNDHTYTFTQCRLEAKARFHTDTVIAVDSDEFLFCPGGGVNPKSQYLYQQNLFANYRKQGYDQVTFLQRILVNKTNDSPEDCMKKSMQEFAKNPAISKASIFDCFAPIRYFSEDFLPKSVHLTNRCPFTTDHHAAPLEEAPRLYDCPGKSIASSRCYFAHLSMRDSDYNKEEGRRLHGNDASKEQLELKKVVDYYHFSVVK